jgi:hypothetical protein
MIRVICVQLFFRSIAPEAIKIASGKVAVVPASEDNVESCAKWTPAFSIAMDELSEPLLNGSDGSR